MKTLSPEVKRLAASIWKAIGSPLSTELKVMLDEGDWVGIAQKRVEPRDYTDAANYFLDAQASSLLRKYEALPTSKPDRRRKALENWSKGEAECYKTNERLSPYLEGMTHPDCNGEVYRHVVGIRKIVDSVLGKAPSMDALSGKFGPGATFSDPSVRSTVADKMNTVSSLTSGAKWFILPWMQTKWGRLSASSSPQRSPVFVRGNRFSVAPKDALKDRAIAAEPSINVYFQLALGSAVRPLLKKVGIDLDGGQDVHRQVACEASISGLFATLDLSNASDTVAYNLVRLLLPPDWFTLFDELRSSHTRFSPRDLPRLPVNGDSATKAWVKLEKFSSMGNGFTFELETLVFFAIVKYIEMCFRDGDDSLTLVYGDDIICNTDIVPAVIQALRFFGFTLNEEKSFSVGPFRESCGGDFFFGQAVRPYFLKEDLFEPQHFIAAANALRACAEASPQGFALVRSAWFGLLDSLPTDIRHCRGPSGLGDVVIHDEVSKWSTRWRSQTKYVRVYRPCRYLTVPFKLFDPDVVHACALYGVPWTRGQIMVRDPIQGYKLGWMTAYGSNWTPGVRQFDKGGNPLELFELKSKSVGVRVFRKDYTSPFKMA